MYWERLDIRFETLRADSCAVMSGEKFSNVSSILPIKE